MTSPWFPGKGRTAEDEAFLTALRSAADEHGLVDATPADTTLVTWEDTVVVLVRVPGLQDGDERPTLEVVHELPGPRLSCGVETWGHVADSYEPMDLTGVDRTPSALGAHAFEWFTAQLRRPVERAAWRTWRGERSLLRFADDGELIEWDLAAHRRRDQPPDHVVRLR